MACPRQCFFDIFNGQGLRSAWGPPETIPAPGGYIACGVRATRFFGFCSAAKMDVSRQFCFDTFNGERLRSAPGLLETIAPSGGYRRE